jgi:hypothetical protein
MTSRGRRLTLILMAATLLIWIFALWALQTALGIRYLDLVATWREAAQAGWGASSLIPAALLITLAVAAPLLMWSLCEEWTTRYTVAEDGLTYQTLPGIALHYPWSAIREMRTGDDDDAVGELIVRPGALSQIRNPVARWLHRQAFGDRRVPLYAGVEARDELLNQIVRRCGSGLIVTHDALAEHAIVHEP